MSKIVLVVGLLGIVAGVAYFRLRAPAPDHPVGGDAPSSVPPPPSSPPSSSPWAAEKTEKAGAEDFAPLFAERLAALAVQQKLVATATRNVVSFDLDSIQLDTKLEHDDPADGKRGIGIAV